RTAVVETIGELGTTDVEVRIIHSVYFLRHGRSRTDEPAGEAVSGRIGLNRLREPGKIEQEEAPAGFGVGRKGRLQAVEVGCGVGVCAVADRFGLLLVDLPQLEELSEGGLKRGQLGKFAEAAEDEAAGAGVEEPVDLIDGVLRRLAGEFR